MPGPMREPLLTRRFAGLWVFAFLAFFSAFQLLPVIPFRILDLGGTKAAAGWFLTVYTFASAFAAPVMGTVADHVGRKRLLIAASLLFSVFSLLYAVITSLPLLLIVGVFHGAMWSAILSSSSAIMSEFIPESRRTQGLAWWGLAGNAAVAVAPAAGLFVYRWGWGVLCVELAVLAVVMLVWSWWLPVVEERRLTATLAVRDTWDWRVTRTALSFAVISFGYGGITSYVAILSRERGVKPESLYFTVFAVTIVLVRVFGAHLGDRYGPKPILYPSFLCFPLAFGLLTFADARWEIIVSALLFGVGFGAAFPTFTTFILANSDPARRARTFGSIVWAFDTGIGTGSLAVGAMAQRYGLATAFGVSTVLSCLALPIFIAAARDLGNRAYDTVPQ